MSRSGFFLIYRLPASDHSSLPSIFVHVPFHLEPQSRKLAAFTKFLHPSTQSDLLAALKLNGKPTGTSSRKTTEGVNNREGYHKCNLGEMFNKVFPAQTVESLSPKRSQATTRPCLSLLSVDHCPPLYSKQSASDLEVIDIER
ncbi:hypothetical protein Plhal304r1_c037g0113301 [Plasmopara halstedii]